MSYKFVTGALVGDISLITEDTIEAVTVSGSGLGRFLTLNIGGGDLTVDAAGALAGGVISGSSFLAHTTITSTGIISSSAALKGASLDVNNGQLTVSSAGALTSVGVISSSGPVTSSGLTVKTTAGALIMEVNSAANTVSSSAATSIKSLNVNNGKATIASTGNTLLAGTVQFSGITADTALVVADDGLFFNDGRDGTVKNVNIGSFVSDIAGAGLSTNNNQLTTAGNTVTAGSTAMTLAVGYNYFTGTESSNASLPTGSASSVGDTITVKDTGPLAAGQAITISRSGSGGSAVDRIDGQTSVVLQSPYGSITFIYLAEKVWGIV